MNKTYNLTTNGATRRKPLKSKTDVNSKGRAPFTTMIRPELRDTLDAVAYNNRETVADVLETIVCEYFDIKMKG